MNLDIQTPYHIFSEKAYESNLMLIDSISRKSNISILLAFKAYIPYHSSELTEKYLSGLAVSSLYEMKMAKEYFPNMPIHLYMPAYDPLDYLELMTISGNLKSVVFNSYSQFNKFKDSTPEHINIDIRINPQHIIKDSTIFDGYNPNTPFARFGITQKELHKEKWDTRISGIHFHGLNAQNSTDLLEMVEAIEDKFGSILSSVKRINLGGGHNLTEPSYDVNTLSKISNLLHDKYNLEVSMEPSEYVFKDVGTLQTKVLSLIHNDIDIAILDTSAKSHMPDILESPYYNVEIETAKYGRGESPYSYRLGGCTCLTGDIIGDFSFDAPLEEDQILSIKDQIPYTIVQSIHFNGFRKPGLVVLDKDNNIKLFKNDSYELYKKSTFNIGA